MRATREMILFLVVLAIAGLWGFLALSGGADEKQLRVPNGPRLSLDIEEWVPGEVTVGLPTLDLPDRVFALPKSETTPLAALVLPAPRQIDLPVTLPPPSPRPGWGTLAALRRPLAAAKGAEEVEAPDNGNGDEGDVEPVDEDDLEDLMNPTRRVEIPEAEWKYLYDSLTMVSTEVLWGEIQDRQGRKFGKYDVPFDSKDFWFVWKDPKTGRVLGASTPVRDSIVRYQFAQTVENAFWIGYRTVPPKEPGRFEGLLTLGRELMEGEWRTEDEVQEALDFASRCFREALEIVKDDVRTVLLLSECHARRGEWDENLALLEDVSGRVDDPAIAIALGEVYEAFDLPDQAERTYVAGLAAHPTSSAVRRRLADVQLATGKVDEARAHYQNLVQFAASETDRAAAHVGLGLVALLEGRLDDVVKAADGADRAAGKEEASALALRAAALYLQRKWSAAAEAAKAALEADPDHLGARRTLGLALAFDGSLDEAKGVFEAALMADPFLYADAHLGLGLVAMLSRDFGTGVEHIETALAAAPRDPYLQYMLGVSYRRDGPVEDAKTRLETALRLAPGFTDVLRQLGLVHQARGEWAESVKVLRRAVELEPKDPDLRYVLISSLIRDESLPRKVRLTDAREHLEAMLRLRPDDPLALNGLGYVTYMLDAEQSKEARARFDRVQLLKEKVADDPDGTYAKQISTDIRDHESKVLWADGFDRGELDERWKVYPEGVLGARPIDGRCRLHVRRQTDPDTLFYQDLDQGPRGRGSLVEVGATLILGEREDVTIGLTVFKQTRGIVGEVSIGRNFKNEIVYRQFDPRNKEKTWKTVLTDPEDPESARKWPTTTGEPVRVVIRRTGDRIRSQYSLYVNDELVVENLPVSTLGNRSDKYRIGFRAKGTLDGEWQAMVDDVYMILKR